MKALPITIEQYGDKWRWVGRDGNRVVAQGPYEPRRRDVVKDIAVMRTYCEVLIVEQDGGRDGR